MKEVDVPQVVREKLVDLIRQRQFIEMQIQRYAEGCMDGMKLKGSWSLDFQEMKFKQVEE